MYVKSFALLASSTLMVLATVSTVSATSSAPAVWRATSDGCDLGGGGADIHAVTAQYRAARHTLEVVLHLCGPVRKDANYAVHIDHEAPHVSTSPGGATAPECTPLSDTVVSRQRNRHVGIGWSQEEGQSVRFTIPTDRLGIDSSVEGQQIQIWARSLAGGVIDHAPNTEHGDGCGKAQFSAETLKLPVSATLGSGYTAFVTIETFQGNVTVEFADRICQTEAALLFKGGVYKAWLGSAASVPASWLKNTPGPFVRADGKLIATDFADLTKCGAGPISSQCLQAPLNQDALGSTVEGYAWTNVNAQGELAGTNPQQASCNNWSTNRDSVQGFYGEVNQTNPLWTNTFPAENCSSRLHLYCFQYKPSP